MSIGTATIVSQPRTNRRFETYCRFCGVANQIAAVVPVRFKLIVAVEQGTNTPCVVPNGPDGGLDRHNPNVQHYECQNCGRNFDGPVPWREILPQTPLAAIEYSPEWEFQEVTAPYPVRDADHTVGQRYDFSMYMASSEKSNRAVRNLIEVEIRKDNISHPKWYVYSAILHVQEETYEAGETLRYWSLDITEDQLRRLLAIQTVREEQ